MVSTRPRRIDPSSGCCGKRRYETLHDAEIDARCLRRTNNRLRAYSCRCCGGYHLGETCKLRRG